MKMYTLKTKLKNRTKFFISLGATFFAVIIYILRFDEDFVFLRFLLIVLPLVFAVVFALLPFVLTFIFIRLVLIIHKDQSTVDYLTYVDQSMLNEFNWDEDPVNHLIGQVDRMRAEATENANEQDFARGLLPQAKNIAPEYSLRDIEDIPDFDPSGPSPFKKV